jgi:hypothetical protein
MQRLYITDRLTMLHASLVEPLQAQIAFIRQQHMRDLATGYSSVELPSALAHKYPGVGDALHHIAL